VGLGADHYGAWLVLTAVPTFLTFSDFGFTFVAKNEMVIAVAAGDRDRALGTFQSIFGLLNIVAPLIALGAVGLVFGFDPNQMLSVHGVALGQTRWILLAFTINVLSYQYFCWYVRVSGLKTGQRLNRSGRPLRVCPKACCSV
jgi:hypothetical protein